MHRPKPEASCLPLFLSALLPWDRLSHWTGCPPFRLSHRAGFQDCVATPSVLHRCDGLALRSSGPHAEPWFLPLSPLPSPSGWSLVTGLSCLCFCSSQFSLFCLHFRETFRFPAMPCGWSLPSACQEAILFLPGLSCGCWKDSCLFMVQLSLSCLLLRLLLSLPFDSFAA